jgi:hypothetical protein
MSFETIVIFNGGSVQRYFQQYIIIFKLYYFSNIFITCVVF